MADTEDRLGGHESLHLRLANLQAGQYKMVTYHHDSIYADGNINVYVDDALGTRPAATGFVQSTGTSPADVASLRFEFTADGVNPVVVHLEEIDGTADNETAVLNGFEIVPTPIAVEPMSWGAVRMLFR